MQSKNRYTGQYVRLHSRKPSEIARIRALNLRRIDQDEFEKRVAMLRLRPSGRKRPNRLRPA